MIIDPAFYYAVFEHHKWNSCTNKHNINFGSLNMTVQRMPNILQYVLQYALAVSYRIAIRLQPQYPPLMYCQTFGPAVGSLPLFLFAKSKFHGIVYCSQSPYFVILQCYWALFHLAQFYCKGYSGTFCCLNFLSFLLACSKIHLRKTQV